MEKKISSELIYDGKIIQVFKDKVSTSNGNIATREVVRHHGGVGVLAIVNDAVLLVQQFRYANEQVTLEIPAGKLEKGEDVATCAIRELEEETGYRASSITKISKFSPTPGYCDEWLHIFHAHDLVKVENPLPCDEDEDLEVILLPLKTAYQYILEGKIIDAKTVIAIMYALLEKNNT